MEFYHVFNRGVDKRIVFADTQDYVRFERNLCLLNNKKHVPTNKWTIQARMAQNDREPIVIIHAYCLIPNHYHLLISPIIENGISLFMQKINMGYSKYFNERNDRTGALWQGKYKSVHVNNDAHFNYIPFYIHLNALDTSMPKWRSGEITNFKNALKNMNDYRWSSHHMYLHPEQIKSSIIMDSFFATLHSNETEYLNKIKKIISSEKLASASKTIQ